MKLTNEMRNAARSKGEEMGTGMPGAFVKAMGDIAVAGLEAAVSASPAGVKPLTMEDIHREQLDRDRLKPASDKRPANCRFRLQDEGKGYPRSGCAACGKDIFTGLGRSCAIEPAGVGVAPADIYKIMKRYKDNSRFDWDFVSQMCRDIAALTKEGEQ